MTMNSLMQPDLLEWDAPLVSSRARAPCLGPKLVPPSLRDLYIEARFPGLVRCGADLGKVELVIEGAWRYVDDREPDRALELLDLAIAQCPFDKALRLARLEIAFLQGDGEPYGTLAWEFQRLFGARQGDRLAADYHRLMSRAA